MNNLMQKRPFVVGNDNYKKLERLPLKKGEFQEEWLQKLLQNSPQLLPVAEIDAIYAPLICIGREVATAAGYIDNLYISPKGYLTIVETKLWRNPEARREVVGQIIDYAKELKQFSYERLDKAVRIYNKNYFGKEIGIFDMMVQQGFLQVEDEALFADLVDKNLSSARFLLLVVGDGIRDGVWRMAEFLNSTPNMHYNIGLVELEVYRMSDEERLVIPNLLMKTYNVERGVFRIEQGSIVAIEPEKSEIEFSSANANNKTTKEEFIKQLIQVNPGIDEEDAVRFFEDLTDLGYVIMPYGKSGLRVKYLLPGGGNFLNIIYFSVEKGGKALKNQGSLEGDLIKYGYSSQIANEFYNAMQTYRNDSLGGPKTINHSLSKMIQSADEVIGIFEKLKNNF